MTEQLQMLIEQALKIVDDVFKASNGNRETHAFMQRAQARIQEELMANQLMIAQLQEELAASQLTIAQLQKEPDELHTE